MYFCKNLIAFTISRNFNKAIFKIPYQCFIQIPTNKNHSCSPVILFFFGLIITDMLYKSFFYIFRFTNVYSFCSIILFAK